MITFDTLYKRTSTGAVQQWTITVDGDSFYTEGGKVGGKIRTNKPTICEGKNIDKANETTAHEQAIKQATAKWEKQLKSKYWKDINDIDKVEFISPTLAKPFKDRKKAIPYPVGVQIKFNGVCCISDSEFGSRSRKGEVFYNIRHINKELDELREDFPDLVVHGELYHYDLRENLNRLIRLVATTRKEKDITPELVRESEEIVQLHIYDGYLKGHEDEPYDKRMALLKAAIGDRFKYVFATETHLCDDMEAATAKYDEFIADKQEGAIVRIMDTPYLHKRTDNILKLKQFLDAEYEVIGFIEGKGNWTGCAKKAVCRLADGNTFNSNIRGTQEFLKEVLEDTTGKYLGQHTIDYQDMSEYGIPQLPYTSLNKELLFDK